jgi:hypothetical protein
MAISVFPTPITSVVDVTSFVTIAAANTLYETVTPIPAGTYTITCPAANVANVQFLSGATQLASGATVSGTVNVTISSDATSIMIWTLSGTDILVGFKKTGNTLSNAFSGTYNTHTSDATITAPGLFYFTVVGAGGGGGGRFNTAPSAGGGGGSGGVYNVGPVTVTSTYNVSIGTAGTGASGTTGNSGNATTLTIAGGSTYTSNGGGGGTLGSGGAGGTPGGGNGGAGSQSFIGGGGGASAAMSPTYVGSGNILGTTGGGAGGGDGGAAVGGGSGIGTGGSGGPSGGTPGAGTGFGSGGGGAASNGNNTGGSGTPGVVYAVKIA